MFCPKCSQQQPQDEMRFCSRCGFPISGVAILLDNNGFMPPSDGISTQKSISARNRMLLESGILTVFAWAVAFAATWGWDFGGALETVSKMGFIVFSLLGLIGLLRFLYAFLFVKATPDQQIVFTNNSSDAAVLREGAPAALPAQRSTGISDYPRRANTKEMAHRPPSVTENTTRLLDE